MLNQSINPTTAIGLHTFLLCFFQYTVLRRIVMRMRRYVLRRLMLRTSLYTSVQVRSSVRHKTTRCVAKASQRLQPDYNNVSSPHGTNELLKPNSITLAGSKLVRSWFEPDSVMEFGFYCEPNTKDIKLLFEDFHAMMQIQKLRNLQRLEFRCEG